MLILNHKVLCVINRQGTLNWEQNDCALSTSITNSFWVYYLKNCKAIIYKVAFGLIRTSKFKTALLYNNLERTYDRKKREKNKERVKRELT